MPTAGTRAAAVVRTDPATPGIRSESPVLDVIFIAATIALFAIVGLIAKGVEKL